MKKLYYSLFVLFSFLQAGICCSVVPISFCESSERFDSSVILSGVILSEDIDGIDLEVMEVFRGLEMRSTIRIWDGTDFDCNGGWSMSASDLGEVGDSLVFNTTKN